MISCSVCGASNRPGKRFCVQCGSGLELRCSSCGAPADAGDRFCGECGSPLVDAPAVATPRHAEVVSERRLVSVLFADLVGFTTLSERRDPEEVRELLSRYFERCRALIERYGGTVEKFIGDAVMAVWGTPVAREDDAERAVRAALALTQAVTALGEEVGMPGLRVRAGVLTGSAAVDLGAEGEGMVLGDTVNTASRLQSIAAPGAVLVDDVTRRASESAIVYEDTGTHELKGREQPVRAYTALRVVAGAGGARRGAGVEPPFVGRDAELQAIIESGESSAGDARARHVAVVGEAGAGKSRLLWEYFKYIDGIVESRWWHQGRCLSYGEGVAYWALAEMVRTRAGILEDEQGGSARGKLRAAIEEHVPDERERLLVEPRLAHLLRLEERPDADSADLFSGCRLFFERMAASAPVILVFEDLQWADSGLLDFIDYLLDWSADFPIFVLTLGRPELRERRPAWQPLTLDPLTPQVIATILEGLAPGLPDELVADIVHRADGIPLYAVETIRMLLDRGLLVQEGSRYIVTGDVEDLDVPETLHALIASRLDGLAAGERSLLQDASVLGQSFTAAGAALVSGRAEIEVEGVLRGLVAKQVLGRDDDPRSPERGQYVFLQALLRTVAYNTLARRARKARHIAAAHYLRDTWTGEAADIAEVLATHYLEAIRAEPDAGDVPELRASARQTLTTAGRAAASLGLGAESQRYFEQAADLADDELERAALVEQAGRALRRSGDVVSAEARLRRAIDLYDRNGRTGGGTAAEGLAGLLKDAGRLDEARAVLERLLASSEPDTSSIVRAHALATMSVVLVLSGAADEAGPLYDEALTTLEAEQAWPELASALIDRAVYLIHRHRLQEGSGALRQAIVLAEQHDLPPVSLRARFNLGAVELESDRLEEAVDVVQEGLRIARERGDRQSERLMLSQLVSPLVALGRWDEAMIVAAPLLSGAHDADTVTAAAFVSQVAAARGDDELFEVCMSLAAEHLDTTHVDDRASATVVMARAALERAATSEVLELSRSVMGEEVGSQEYRTEAYALAIDAALAADDEAVIAELEAFVAELPPVRATPLLRAGRARLAAERAHRRGDSQAEDALEREAVELLRSVGARPLLARALIERANRRDDRAALAEAREIYTQLGAARWLARVEPQSGMVA
jgi:class 3 adenylate cyclase/tetratricopeptide (TPR) repeat protein